MSVPIPRPVAEGDGISAARARNCGGSYVAGNRPGECVGTAADNVVTIPPVYQATAGLQQKFAADLEAMAAGNRKRRPK